ncbi:MAG: hypothetical protein ACYCWW_05280 [Deltaproteobacteria bacterium]
MNELEVGPAGSKRLLVTLLLAVPLALAVGGAGGFWLGRRSSPGGEPPPVVEASAGANGAPVAPPPAPAVVAPPAAVVPPTLDALVPIRAPLAPAAAEAEGPGHSRREAETLHRRVQDELEAKGLLPGDLPPEARRLDDRIYAALRASDWNRAIDLTNQLGRAVAAIQIDRSFLDQKLKRLSARRAASPPGAEAGAGASAEIDALLEEATALAADGQYGSANRRINRIAALLR